MIKVQSFDIADSEGINALLLSYRLAGGAHILVSDGKVCIPYEDGEPDNAAQQVIAIAEQRNVKLRELEIIEHSQRVNEVILADAKDRANFAEVEWKNYTSSKALEAKRDAAKNEVSAMEQQIAQNEREIVRIKKNIELFDARIEELKQ